MSSKTTEELLVSLQNLETVVDSHLKSLMNERSALKHELPSRNGVWMDVWYQYAIKPETKQLLTKIREIRTELRERGYSVPNDWLG